MKLTMLLLFITCFHANAHLYSQEYSLKVKDESFINVINQISKMTGYSLLADAENIKTAGTVSFEIKKGSVTALLDACFNKQPFTYQILNKSILIKKRDQLVVSGNVYDTAGNAIANASVQIKGKTTGTVTNENGHFTISTSPGDVLVISYVGYKTMEVTVTNHTTTVNIVLRTEQKVIEQVVVTALGIKRSAKALSYNIQEVKGEELTQNKDANFVNSLNGKVAGVTINSSAAGVGGPVRVVMRGIKSLAGNNNALYVIDGVPLQALTSQQPSDIFGGNTNSDGISNLNPDDIESISVLTGAAGSALYGSLGLNGVILITTKSGAKGVTRVTVSNNTSFLSPFVMPAFQNKYGPSSPGSYYSWGSKLQTPSTYKPENFFQTGYNQSNAINLSLGTEKNQTYVSAALTTAEGIIPNNKLTRYNFTIRNTTSFLNDKLNLDVNVQYINQKEQNMITQGLYYNPLVPVYLFPSGDDFSKYQAYERYDPSRLLVTQFWPYGVQGNFQMQNPYWVSYRNLFPTTKDRFITGATLKYTILKGLTATSRVKFDFNLTNNQVKLYASTLGLFAGAGGRYASTNVINKQRYSDFILNLDKPLGNLRINANLGASDMDQMVNGSGYDGNIVQGSVPNLFTISNIASIDPATGRPNGTPRETNGPRIAMRSVFSTAEVSYKNMLFLNSSYRADWWSQLHGSTSTNFIYPSIGLSAILSDLMNIRSNAVSYIKVRGSYSEVGNTPQSYIANNIVTYPVANGQASNNPRYPTPTLKPERSKSIETGLNVKFLRNKINLDITLYKTNTYNQIFKVIPSGATGASVLYFNAGQVMNKGIEAALSYNGEIGKISWTSHATFTLNRNKILRLLDGFYDERTNTIIKQDSVLVASTGSYGQYLIKGGTAGDIYVSTLLRDVSRQKFYILDGNNKVVPDNNRFVKAGSANPRYTIGFNNNFIYNRFNLSFLITARVGGEVVSATQAIMDGFGVSKTTAEARDRGYVVLNGSQYTDVEGYYSVVGGGTNGVLSQYVYSATNVRMRELSLGYILPGQLLKAKFIKEISLALTGQNLFMFYNKAPFDPEITASTDTYFQGIDYFMQPSLRSVGFNVRLKL